MNIKDLKQTLAKTIQDVEDVYNAYTGKVSQLNSSIKKNECKLIELMNDDAKLQALLTKYNEVDSLTEMRIGAEKLVKEAENRMNDTNKERAVFEQYKSTENARLDVRKNGIINEERQIEQGYERLRKAIADFNIEKEKYHYKTEGEAQF